MTLPISVIIPCYNCQDTLEHCLSTVLGQTFHDFEVIIIDDGSQDDSVNICTRYAAADPRIHIHHQAHQGPGVARNAGIALARGSYLMFLDADDFFEPDLLGVLYHRAILTAADITACRFWVFDDIVKIDREVDWDIDISVFRDRFTFCPRDFPQQVFQIFNTASWFSLYKKDFIVANDIHFSDWIRSEDNLFTMGAVAMAERVSVVNRRLIHYRVNRSQKLENNFLNLWQNTFRAFYEVRAYLEAREQWSAYQNSFIRCLISQVKSYLLTKAPYPVKSFILSYLVHHVIPDFHLMQYDHTVLGKWEEYQWLCRIAREKEETTVFENVFYHNRDRIVPIVYGVCQENVLNAIVSIETIKHQISSDHFYDIYLLHADLDPDEQCGLRNLAQENVHITCVDMRSELPKTFLTEIPNGACLCCLDRLFAGYEKLIYLSPNTLVGCDPADLLALDMQHRVMAACHRDPNTSDEYTVCNLPVSESVSDSVLLIDLPAWHTDKMSERLLNLLFSARYTPGLLQEFVSIGGLHRTLFLGPEWCREIKATDSEMLCSPRTHIMAYDIEALSSCPALSERWWSLARKSPLFEMILLKAVQQGSFRFSSAYGQADDVAHDSAKHNQGE